MDCKIDLESKQEVLDLDEMFKSCEMTKLQRLKMLWYARGQFDSIMMRENLCQTGT